MRKSHILALATALTAVVATPASADWDKVASISVTYGTDSDSRSPDFGGPVERLQFTARGSDIQCQFIRATFGNGQTRDLFSGRLPQGNSRVVDLPGTQRNVKQINTKCHAFQRSGSSIDVAADIGEYRDTWRRSPNWNAVWARMFNWSNQGSSVDQAMNYWVPITTLHFYGRGDRDGSAAGWAGKSIGAVGLKPNRDARCGRITMVFQSGRQKNLGPRNLLAGTTTRFDMPGYGDRNLARLNLACHALAGSSVDIGVYGRK